jgi:hypothetical protein
MFENRVRRRIFGPEGEEVAGSCRRLHEVELHNSYASPNLMRVMKSRRRSWAVHVARMGELNEHNFHRKT